MSQLSPITAHPVKKVEWEIAAANTRYSASLLQEAGMKILYNSKGKCEKMLHNYNYSYERMFRVNMARTKGSVQREREQEKDRDSDHEHEEKGRKVRPSKKGRKRKSPRPLQYICYFCDKT